MAYTNLTDRPVASFDESEPLGLSRYAKALADFIKDCDTPITIGIQGDWGVGKTSLLNMVQDRLSNETYYSRNVYEVIYFNTWQYAQLDQEDHLTIAMLHDIVLRIKELSNNSQEADKQANQMLSSIAKIAAAAGNQLAENHLGVNPGKAYQEGTRDDQKNAKPAFLQMMDLMVHYREQFESLVAKYMENKPDYARLVIMIDDLDRIRPARALDLLSSVKNFLDVPRCVFVLAVDYSVIQRGVEEKMGASERKQHGKSYFDKIIQVPFNMPVSSYHVEKYILSLLGWHQSGNSYRKLPKRDNIPADLYFESHQTIEGKAAKEIENFVRLTIGKNPRSIKRAVNYFSLLKRVFDENNGPRVAKKRDLPEGRRWQSMYLELLFGFSCLQLAYPEVFDLFAKSPSPKRIRDLSEWDTLSELSQIDYISERVEDIDQVKTNITGFFDQIIAIIDADDNWNISPREFQPVWDIVKCANLAGGKLKNTDDAWEEIKEMVVRYANESNRSAESVKKYESGINILKRSPWNNPLHLRAVNGGSTYFNLLWDGKIIGSVTSTKSNPLQFYIVADSYNDFKEELSDDAQRWAEHVGTSHWGEGSILLHVLDLDDSELPTRPLLQEYHQAMLKQL